MKKMLFTLTVLVAAAAALTFSSCKKDETAGEKLDKATEDANAAGAKFTKKADNAVSETNKAVGDAINDVFSSNKK